MKKTNLETVGAVTHTHTHTHYTSSETKIDDNTLLKTAGVLWLCMKNKMEIL